MAGALSGFPHLSATDFQQVCTSFVSQCNDADVDSSRWSVIRFDAESECVIIDRPLRDMPPHLQAANVRHESSKASRENQEILEMEDEEELKLAPQSHSSQVTVHYEILLSPTYRVPVLYFSLGDLADDVRPSLDTLYELLVPAESRDALLQTGVLGGISMANHPRTGKSTHFVHPCNTASAMEEVASGLQIDAENYLSIWVGIVGAAIGLCVPMPRVAEMS